MFSVTPRCFERCECVNTFERCKRIRAVATFTTNGVALMRIGRNDTSRNFQGIVFSVVAIDDELFVINHDVASKLLGVKRMYG